MNYNKLISELLQSGTPRQQYEFLKWLLDELSMRTAKIKTQADVIAEYRKEL